MTIAMGGFDGSHKLRRLHESQVRDEILYRLRGDMDWQGDYEACFETLLENAYGG